MSSSKSSSVCWRWVSGVAAPSRGGLISKKDRVMNITCPRCGKEFMQRTTRNGSVEDLLGVVYVYPFRCQFCSHRFRTFQPGVRYHRTPVDRRQYERMAVQLPVALTDESGEYRGITLDLSLGGCATEAMGPFSENSLWNVRLHAPQDPRPITVEAAVVRSARASRIGLEFLRLAPEEKDRLGRLMFELWRARAALRQDIRAADLAREQLSPPASLR